MNFNLRINVDAPRGAGARIALFLGLPVALVMAAGVAAWAYDTSWIADGQPISASNLKQNLDEVQTRLTALESANQVLSGTVSTLQGQLQAANTSIATLQATDCPAGYTKDANATHTVCIRGADEMVKVGTGREAFWIDRYEASVWSAVDGTGTQYGATTASGALESGKDYPTSFPKNGQRDGSFGPLYAVSKKGAQPSASLTWFQAMEACAASGKRLPDGQEWMRAVSGTDDPGSSNGGGGACVTNASGPRATGGGTTCVSAWGAEDMIGNLWEWTAEWYAGAGQSGGGESSRRVNVGLSNWPNGGGNDYRGDATWNLSTAVYDGQADNVAGLPAAALRGGAWGTGTRAGAVALSLDSSPSAWGVPVGLRCVAR
jgi:formylglycine-generating enzyme required for sulfatase activity